MIAPKLGVLTEAAESFHRITVKSVLNSYDLKLLLLHVEQPEISLELLCNIPKQIPHRLLAWYLQVILAAPTSKVLSHALVEFISALPIPIDLLELTPTDLVCLAYIYHAALTFETPHVIDRLLWLPRLSSQSLEILQSALNFLQQEYTYWQKLLVRGEELLTLEQIDSVIQQFSSTKQEVASHTNLAGIWVVAVCGAINEGVPLQELDQAIATPRSLLGNYFDVAQILQKTIAISKKVDSHLAKQCPTFDNISTLIDWYRTQDIHTQELKISRAIRSVLNLKQLPGELLQKIIDQLRNLRIDWRDFLNLLDKNLADLVTGSHWTNFCKHPRHSTQFLSDQLPNQIPKNSNVWLLIFDGMRLDSWDLVIRPVLENYFQIEDKTYLASLPSITDIARIALIAGSTPDQWKNSSGLYIKNHDVLAARRFKIPQDRRKEELQIVVRSETIEGQLRLGLNDSDAKKYNILIYNVSDDWIHNWRDDLSSLNDFIQDTLVKSIVPDIISRISSEDIVFLSSDHGFVELERADQIQVNQIDKYNVRYRYLKTTMPILGRSVSYGSADYTYRVAVGREWFNRPDSNNMERFTHGGISLDEMVVPGAILKPLSKRVYKLEILNFPNQIETTEDKEIKLELSVYNSGTVRSSFSLKWHIDDNPIQTLQGEVEPKESVSLTFKGLAIVGQQLLKVELFDNEGTRHIVKRIPLKVIARRDKVEFSDPLAGLDFDD
jgi:PglZ domain